MERHGRLPQLLTNLQRERPHVNWDGRAPADMPCPYRGLLAFRKEDAHFFFGREALTERLAMVSREQGLVAVVGPSGSGKSSW